MSGRAGFPQIRVPVGDPHNKDRKILGYANLGKLETSNPEP